MIFLVALRSIARHALPLGLHAVALGLAIFFFGFTLLVSRIVGEPLVPSARCPDGARQLQLSGESQFENVHTVLERAESFTVATLRRAGFSENSSTYIDVSLYEPALFEAMCFDVGEGRAPIEGRDLPEAFVHPSYPSLDVRVGVDAQVGLARFMVVGAHPGFHGLGSATPAIWIPESYAPMLGFGPRDAATENWLIPRQGANWARIRRELDAIVAAHPGYFGNAYELVAADGRTTEQLKTSAQGVFLLVLIATGIALAVAINLATYFASRQPAFTELAGILHMLGAPLTRQYGLALSEPLLITMGAMATAMVCHTLLAQRMEDLLGDAEVMSGALLNYALAGVVVAISMAALRVHHVLRSGRAGVAAARRWSARLYPIFLGAQVMAAAVIVAVAAISLLHWQRIQPGQYSFDLDRTWHLTFAAGSAPLDAASANQRFEAAVLDAQSDGAIELALSTTDAPLVQRVRAREAEDEAAGHPDDLEAVVSYASANWLDLIGIEATPVANGLATPGRDAVLVNRRFMTARWPDGVPEFPYLVPPRAPVRRVLATSTTNEDDPPPASDRVLPIVAVFSEKDAERADVDDLIQPTVLLPLNRRPEQPVYQLSGLLRTREPRTAAWVRQRAMGFERLIGLALRAVEPARAVVDRGVENERRRAELYAQLAVATLVVTLSGMMALCAAMAMSMRRELATRFSLGWSRRAVVLTLLVRLTRPIAIGSALGLVLGALGLQLLSKQTPGLSNLQASALIATAVVLVAAGVIAAFQPWREALQARFAMWLRDE